jgi:hypothetical protein
MKKNMIKKVLGTWDLEEIELDLPSLISWLKEFEEDENYENNYLEIKWDYEGAAHFKMGSATHFMISGSRLETDLEFKKRKKQAEKLAASKKRDRLKKYNKIKKEYEELRSEFE